jgi:pimeloyl-ACP methyl ester carboxylesterase
VNDLPVSILLPGLDGTGELFDAFIAAAPAGFPVGPLRLPRDRPRGYAELAQWVRTALPAGPVTLIAESFSGPLAILVADQCPNVSAIVLCASFVEPPLPAICACIPTFCWRFPPPRLALRALLTGGDRTLARAVRNATRQVSSDILAARIAAVLRVNVVAELQRYSRPLLYLRARRDRLVRPHVASRIRQLAPHAQFADIDSPHLLLQSRPAEAWAHIKPFLEAPRGSHRDPNAGPRVHKTRHDDRRHEEHDDEDDA